MRAHVLCLSVTGAVCSANRTHCAGHVELSHTHPPGEPIRSESIYQHTFCPSRDQLHRPRAFSGPGFTPASEHVGVSCQARPEPRARRRANPARFPKQLRPLLGLCPSVSVALSRSSSRVSRDSHTSPLHSLSETRLRAPACRPSSPSHTATSHTLSLSHSAAHSRMPFPSHTWFHSHTAFHSHRGFYPHTVLRSCTGSLSHTRSLSHTPLHPRYARVAARILSHSYTHTSTPHTPGQPHWGIVSPQGFPGPPCPPSSVCTRQQHSPPLTRLARPNSPGRDSLQESIASPFVPGGGYPAARTGSTNSPAAHAH